MKFELKKTALIISSLFIVNLSSSMVFAEDAKKAEKAAEPKPALENIITVSPLDLTSSPINFMNKNIKIKAKFNKFSTLGLDYDKAMRSSKEYISVLIKRPNVDKSYTIPLSELKLIMKRDEAEDLIDLENGDNIEITGTVFSTALNDPWVDVYELKSLDINKDQKASK